MTEDQLSQVEAKASNHIDVLFSHPEEEKQILSGSLSKMAFLDKPVAELVINHLIRTSGANSSEKITEIRTELLRVGLLVKAEDLYSVPDNVKSIVLPEIQKDEFDFLDAEV